MGNITKIIVMNGGVETLDFFSNQMAETWKEKGISVFVFDLKNAGASAKRVRKFIKPGHTALVTFNFEGLEREADVYSEASGYLWQEYQIPCYNIAADHPYFYDNRLRELLSDEKLHPGILKNYHHLSIDRNHQSYFQKFYPEFDDAGFCPLAGTSLASDLSWQGTCQTVSSSEMVQDQERKQRTTDVIFTGNYTEPSFFNKNIHWINEEYAAFYQGIINELIVHPDRTIEEVELAHCEREMGANSTGDLRPALHKMIFIDLYLRNYFRGKIVAAVCDAGIPVTVIGKGWEKLTLSHKENLKILPQTDSKACLEALWNAKISLNVMPWFKDGAHDRVFNSILNGAVCVSDMSRYLCDELPEGFGVCYYDLNHPEQAVEKIRLLLSENDKREQILEAGMPLVKKGHTWRNRAEQLLALFVAAVV